MNKAEFAKMMQELTPAELRALTYEIRGGHSCARSTTLYYCCGEQRCEACHVPHLKEKHSTPELYAYEKFVSKWQLTWQGYVPPKQPKTKVNKKRTKPAGVQSTASLVASLDDDSLEAALELLAKKLGK